jgi:hypothetical protein
MQLPFGLEHCTPFTWNTDPEPHASVQTQSVHGLLAVGLYEHECIHAQPCQAPHVPQIRIVSFSCSVQLLALPPSKTRLAAMPVLSAILERVMAAEVRLLLAMSASISSW